MKIENGKIIFELEKCCMCEDGIQTIHDPCPMANKVVNRLPGKKCPHCGATRKGSHHSTSSHTVTCYTCKGAGKVMEDFYCWISQAQWNEMVDKGLVKFTVSRANRNRTFNENYLGLTPSIFGCTDYGRTAALSDEEILKTIPKDNHPGQYLQWISADGTFPTEYVIEIQRDGYSVKPTQYMGQWKFPQKFPSNRG